MMRRRGRGGKRGGGGWIDRLALIQTLALEEEEYCVVFSSPLPRKRKNDCEWVGVSGGWLVVCEVDMTLLQAGRI